MLCRRSFKMNVRAEKSLLDWQLVHSRPGPQLRICTRPLESNPCRQTQPWAGRGLRNWRRSWCKWRETGIGVSLRLINKCQLNIKKKSNESEEKRKKTDDKSYDVLYQRVLRVICLGFNRFWSKTKQRPYFVSVPHPPRAACEPANLRISLVCYFRSWLIPSGDLTVALPFSFFVFRFRFGRRFVSCCLSLSPRFLLRLVQRDMYLIRTYASLTFLSCLVHDLFQLLCILCFVIFYSFDPEVIFHSEVIRPVTTDCIVSWRWVNVRTFGVAHNILVYDIPTKHCPASRVVYRVPIVQHI